MSPAEIAPAIQQKYAEHSTLLAELAATDYVPVALKVNEKKIEEIKKALTQKQEAVKGLERKTKTEYKDISELQRSGTKRFLLRLKVGAENAQKTLAKEEKEYMDAFQAENNEKLAISTLEEELNNAKLSNIDLKAKADRYQKARKRLDELYVELFEGHTNDYPEEDEAEQAVKESEAKHAKDQERLTKLSQGHSWLHKAEKSMEKVLERLNKAEEASLKELAAVTQNYNVYEMKDLKAAKKYALEVETYIGEARKLDPRVANLGQISIPFQDAGYQPQFGSDKGDLIIHRLISDANKECIRYQAKLEVEASKAKPQVKEATKVAVESGTDLAKKRAKLEEIRRKIFEDIHKGILPEKGPWVPTQGIPDNDGPSPGGFGGPSPGGFGGPSLGGFGGPSPGGFGGPSPGGFGGPTFPSINVSTDSPTSVRSFPAGGFRSPHGSIEVASPHAEGGDAPGFPISPAFQHPVDRIAPTEPGFRRTAEMNVIASIAAVSIPAATPWAINREAAAMLLNAAQEPIDGEDADFSMPQAPGSPQMPGGNVTIPPTPSSPGFPSSPAEAAFSTIQTKPGEEIAYDGPRVKLFKFDSTSDPAKWDDVGSGRLRVISEKESKTVRLVISTPQGSNPILDRPIRNGARLLPHPSSDRSFMWTLEAEPKGPFAIRMSSPEAAREVYNAFERVQRIFPAPPPTSGDDIWPAMPSAPGDEPPAIASTSSPPSMPSAPAEAFNAPTGTAPTMPSAPGAPVAFPLSPGSPERPLAMPGGMPTSPSDANKSSTNPTTMPTSPADVKKAATSSAGGVTAGVAALNLTGSQAPSNGGK